jgi:tRNA 5-methylaminomethyl-2-thiouridine biosynthesis bifunctional protein
LGASFNFAETDPAPSAAEHHSNLEMLAEISADLHQRLEADTVAIDQLHGRVAFRCTSPDYLPIIGALADPTGFAQAYAVLAKDARQVPDTPCPWLDGLYVNTAHGSRGLITAPLSGELLAAWLNDEPLPVPRAIAEACHPNRFLLRKLIRRTD